MPGQAEAGGRRGGSQGQRRGAIGRRESGRCGGERECDVRGTTAFVVVDSRGRRIIIESAGDLNATQSQSRLPPFATAHIFQTIQPQKHKGGKQVGKCRSDQGGFRDHVAREKGETEKKEKERGKG